MDSEKPRHRATTRIWIRLAIAAGILVGLLVLTFVVVVVTGAARESRAIEAVRARGEPLSPQEITFPILAEPSDLLERLGRFQAVFEEGPFFRDIDFASRSEFLAELRAAEAWAGAVQPVEALFACAGEENIEFRKWADAVDARLAHPRHAGRLSPCERQLLGARAALRAPTLELARDACRASPETAERLLRDWSIADGLDPGSDRYRVVMIDHAVRALTETAIARAVEGRGEEACELLALAFRGANLVQGWPWGVAHLFWQLAMGNAIDGLRVALESLPPDADLSLIALELAALDVESQFRRALVGDRALGNEMFAALRDGRLAGGDGTKPIPLRGPADLLTWSWLAHDRAFYLDTMTRSIDWTRRPYIESVDEIAAFKEDMEGSLSARFALASPMLIPAIDKLLKSVATMRARIGLARIAIVARRQGTEAALRAAGDMPDPFRAGPLQARVEPDGTLVLWSIGDDRQDERGEGDSLDEDGNYDEDYEQTDIVWRVKPR